MTPYDNSNEVSLMDMMWCHGMYMTDVFIVIIVIEHLSYHSNTY